MAMIDLPLRLPENWDVRVKYAEGNDGEEISKSYKLWVRVMTENDNLSKEASAALKAQLATRVRDQLTKLADMVDMWLPTALVGLDADRKRFDVRMWVTLEPQDMSEIIDEVKKAELIANAKRELIEIVIGEDSEGEPATS